MMLNAYHMLQLHWNHRFLMILGEAPIRHAYLLLVFFTWSFMML